LAGLFFAVLLIAAPWLRWYSTLIDVGSHFINSRMVFRFAHFTALSAQSFERLAAEPGASARGSTDNHVLIFDKSLRPRTAKRCSQRRAVPYADRVLRGAKPSELPIQAPVKF
jgi:hypothetical protein